MTAPALPVSLLGTELRLHRRHGVWAAVAATALVWSGVLLALPSVWREAVLPWLLFLEVATLGFVAAPALAVVERASGVTQALRLTRLQPAAALFVRVALLGCYSMAVALLLLAVAGVGWHASVILGAAAASVLLTLVAVLALGRATTLTAYLGRAPVVAAPLLGPALIDATGLVSHPVLLASPATAAFRLLAGEASLVLAGWVLAWLVALAAAAVRLGFAVRLDAPVSARAGRRRPLPAQGGTPSRLAAVRSLARVDLRSLLGDRLLVLLLVSLPLLAGVARWFDTAGVALVEARAGVDLGPHLPAIWAFVVVIHVPVMVGTLVGLLWSEDRDAGLLPVLATTPASLTTLIGYRLAAAGLGGAAALALVLPLAGVGAAAGAGGVGATILAGGAAATVPAAVTAAFARDRVQAVALMKAMTVPLYLPVAWWFLDTPAAWLLGLVPTAWAAQAFWADSPAQAWLSALAAAVVAAGHLALLVPRMRRPL